MKLLFALLLTLQSDSSKIQWETIEIDEYLTIQLPENYRKINTQGQTMYNAKGNNSALFFTVIPDASFSGLDKFQITSIEQLNNYYDDIEKKFTEKEGEVSHRIYSNVDSLNARIFRIDDKFGYSTIHHVVVIQDLVYLSMVEFDMEDNSSITEKDQFINSLEFNLNGNKQLITPKIEHSTAFKIFTYLLITGVILLILRAFSSKS